MSVKKSGRLHYYMEIQENGMAFSYENDFELLNNHITKNCN